MRSEFNQMTLIVGYDVNVQMGVKGENGEVEDLLNSGLSTSSASVWSSIDVLQIYLTADVARCVNLVIYSIHQNETVQGRRILLSLIFWPTQPVS